VKRTLPWSAGALATPFFDSQIEKGTTMDKRNADASNGFVSFEPEFNGVAFESLSELDLALVGGGIGDTVL